MQQLYFNLCRCSTNYGVFCDELGF